MMRVADCPGAVIGCSSALIHNIRKFESDVLLPVHHLKDKSDDEGRHSECGKHEERVGVVVLQGVGNSGVAGVEYLADEEGEEPESDVLNPEDEGICRPDDFGVDEFGYAGPKRCGYERETGSEDEDGGVCDDDSAHGIALESRKDEGKGEVAGNEEDGAEDGCDADGEEWEDG